MGKIGFWTAVTYNHQPTTCSQRMLEKVDAYLHLGSTKYQVIDPKKGEITLTPDTSRSCWKTALKVVSYALLIPVFVALIAKIILRSVYSFTEVKRPEALNTAAQQEVPAITKPAIPVDVQLRQPGATPTVVQQSEVPPAQEGVPAVTHPAVHVDVQLGQQSPSQSTEELTKFFQHVLIELKEKFQTSSEETIILELSALRNLPNGAIHSEKIDSLLKLMKERDKTILNYEKRDDTYLISPSKSRTTYPVEQPNSDKAWFSTKKNTILNFVKSLSVEQIRETLAKVPMTPTFLRRK